MNTKKTDVRSISNGQYAKNTAPYDEKNNVANGEVSTETEKSILGAHMRSTKRTRRGKAENNSGAPKKAVKTQGLSWKTRHAYHLQSIEISNPDLMEAFPGYHPMWLIQSQKIKVTGKQFKYMREFLVKMNVHECAAYLRVDRTTIGRWESEKIDTPFMAYETLRLLYRNLDFKLASEKWDGWFINDEGMLVCAYQPHLSYQPDDLLVIQQLHRNKSILEAEITKLQHENLSINNELIQLKQIAQNELAFYQGIKSIEVKMQEVLNKIHESKLFDQFNSDDNIQIEARKAA